MIIVPLGIGSAFPSAPYGWTCNLIDGTLLVDAAPQAMLSLKHIGVPADDIASALFTHAHADHLFGFPFILAERDPEIDPLQVIGPEGTAEALEHLCSIAFSKAAPEKMSVLELPAGEVSESGFGDYRLLAAPTDHTPESLCYLITGPDGSRLAYSGDAAWGKGLKTILGKADAAMVEMTEIEEAPPDHLSLRQHLPLLLETVPRRAAVYLTHLSRPKSDYMAELERLRRSLPEETAAGLDRVILAEEFEEYVI
jgi:ribonuclease BN (tRNA processing enzyme)